MFARLRSFLNAPADLPAFRSFELIVAKGWNLFWMTSLMAFALALGLGEWMDDRWLAGFLALALFLGAVRVALLHPYRERRLTEALSKRLEHLHAGVLFVQGCVFALLGYCLIAQAPQSAGAVILATAMAGLIVVPFLAASPMAFMAMTLPLMLLGLFVQVLMPVDGGPIFSIMVFATYCLTTRMAFVHRHALLSNLAAIERDKALARQREVLLANDTVGIAITESLNLLTANGRFQYLMALSGGSSRTDAHAAADLAEVATGFGWSLQRLERLLERAVIRARRKGVVKLTLPFHGGEGATRWLKLEARLADPAAMSPQLLWVVSDHTSNRKAMEELNFLARHDALTGLANRHQFLMRARKVLHGKTFSDESRGTPESLGVAVLCIDLDGFKAINDRYGHAVGDEVLVVIARRLQRAVRSCDLVTRFGGDEFVLLLPQIGRAEAARVVDKLNDVIVAPVEIQQLTLHVGASIGLAMAPEDGTGIDALLVHADRQMYQIKQAFKRSMPARGTQASPR